MTVLKPSEVLTKAADLIEPEGRWFREEYARWSITPQEARANPAECYCALGAISAADVSCRDFMDAEQTPAAAFLCRVLGKATPDMVPDWNDAKDRTQPEVVAALRKASALAKAEGQ